MNSGDDDYAAWVAYREKKRTGIEAKKKEDGAVRTKKKAKKVKGDRGPEWVLNGSGTCMERARQRVPLVAAVSAMRYGCPPDSSTRPLYPSVSMEALVEVQNGGLPSQEDSKKTRGQCFPITFDFFRQFSAADAHSVVVLDTGATASVACF